MTIWVRNKVPNYYCISWDALEKLGVKKENCKNLGERFGHIMKMRNPR